jgi:NAD(P)-dependent dehydrogenase (short-subunit alcohol dehydrogenase family)
VSTDAARDRSHPLAGKVVVVTGAAGGIGAALCRRFASAGASVALLDRDTAAQAAAEHLRSAGVEAAAFMVDIASPEDCTRAIGSVRERFGAIDVLVNNAGITHLSRFADTDAAVLRRVMDVNFFGAAYCTKAALPALLERRGSVVAISSVAGFAPLAGRSGYAASKHALHGMFDTLRAEHARDGLHVMLVCPGFTRTGIEAAALGGDGGPATMARTMFGRVAEPCEVAQAIYCGLRARRRMIVLGPVGKLSLVTTRLLPPLYDWLMARSLKSAHSA